MRLDVCQTDLPGLGATVVPPEGEFLRDWIRELLHSRDWGRNRWREAICPVYLVVSSA